MSVNIFENMLGQTMDKIVGKVGDNQLIFHAKSGKKFTFYHRQDCCESVEIEDIAGDLNDLLHSPLTMAEEVSSKNFDTPEINAESYTWTFYKFATLNGHCVVVRWLGTSNGYYGESVDYVEND